MATVLIAAGGTGGHVYPALAVAKALQERGVDLVWCGTPDRLEAKIVPENHIDFRVIDIKGLRRKGWRQKITAPLMLLRAVVQSIQLLCRIKPTLVIVFGGYVSGPMGIAAKLMRVPLLIHEQNARAGLTNRILHRFSTKTFCAFDNTFQRRLDKVQVVGNPLREQLIMASSGLSGGSLTFKNDVLGMPHDNADQLDPPVKPEDGVRVTQENKGRTRGSALTRLLVLGGSLGAQFLNEIVPAAIALLNKKDRPDIWHQAGEKTVDIARQYYQKNHIHAKVTAYIDDMVEALNWADLIICRAGAMTVSEVDLFQKPAIFVPLPGAVDDHQFYNAQVLVQQGRALCFRQAVLTPDVLADTLRALHEDDHSTIIRHNIDLDQKCQNATKLIVFDLMKRLNYE